MARPGLMRHRKFARLARLLGGDKVAARGHLELLWDAAYEAGDELLGDSGDVEFMAEWHGDSGRLSQALKESGFLDEHDGEFAVHDLWDNAPDYVRKRQAREAERREKGDKLRSSDGQRPVSDRSESGQCPPNGRTRAPAPAPAPIQTPTSAQADVVLVEEQPSAPVAPPVEKIDDKRSAQALEVFEHWRKTMRKTLPCKLPAKQRSAILARLRDGYTVEQLCQAVDGCRATPFNMGLNDRCSPFNDLELICRDTGRVDRFISTASAAAGAPLAAPGAPEPERPCAICGRPVGSISQRCVGDGVLCVQHAMDLDAAPGRPSGSLGRAAWDQAWVADHRSQA